MMSDFPNFKAGEPGWSRRKCEHVLDIDRSFKDKNVYWVCCYSCRRLWRIFTPDKDIIDVIEYQK